MIDNDGYRANVGLIICNDTGQLFWGRRIGQQAWQFPQGGIVRGETVDQALFRELQEETGLTSSDVEIVAEMPGWQYYDLPDHLIRHHNNPVCIGQKQKWFLLRLLTDESRILLNTTSAPEFDSWRWVEYWHPLSEVINFKKQVYQKTLDYFAPLMEQYFDSTIKFKGLKQE